MLVPVLGPNTSADPKIDVENDMVYLLCLCDFNLLLDAQSSRNYANISDAAVAIDLVTPFTEYSAVFAAGSPSRRLISSSSS